MKEKFVSQLLESINFVNLPEAANPPVLKITQHLDKLIEHDFNVQFFWQTRFLTWLFSEQLPVSIKQSSFIFKIIQFIQTVLILTEVTCNFFMNIKWQTLTYNYIQPVVFKKLQSMVPKYFNHSFKQSWDLIDNMVLSSNSSKCMWLSIMFLISLICILLWQEFRSNSKLKLCVKSLVT